MNDVGIGIFCFGNNFYFETTKDFISKFPELNFFILTNKIENFDNIKNINLISYDRNIFSYHDKMILIKKILENHKIAMIIDADIILLNRNKFLDILNYNFEDGITYVDNLRNYKYEKIGDIQHTKEYTRWFDYFKYIKNEGNNLETIHEYVLFVKNKLSNEFYHEYEKLQVVKEYCDIISDKKILGAGEGVSIKIAANKTDIKTRKDNVLYELVSNALKNHKTNT